jgi:hypothetical protein
MTKVLITGGLGNQLFQFASGLFVADHTTLELEFASRDLRRNSSGAPEILDFLLPKRVCWNDYNRSNWLREKYRNFLLRTSSEKLQSRKLLMRCVIAFFNVPFRLRKHRYFVNSGVGFDDKILKLRSNSFLIGDRKSVV